MRFHIYKRKRTQISVPIASMGDIAFLLIIFFMLASTFMKEANVEMDKPVARDLNKLERIPISVTIDRDGIVRFQGDITDAQSLQSLVEEELDNRDDKTVLLKIDRKLVQNQYADVFIALSKAGAELALVGLEEE